MASGQTSDHGRRRHMETALSARRVTRLVVFVVMAGISAVFFLSACSPSHPAPAMLSMGAFAAAAALFFLAVDAGMESMEARGQSRHR